MHPYVIGAVVVGGLVLTSVGLYYRGEAANARADSAEAITAQFKEDLLQSEANNAELRQRRKDLDAIVRERDSRVQNLEAENKSRDEAYEALRASFPREDQSCLARDLPDELAKRLRD
jgi:hypothetical protein